MTASRRSDNTMKPSLLRFTLFVLYGLFLCPPAAPASPPPADSIHFCAFDDYEQWRRDHARPAAKRLTDLNVGEPRTVRMIYFLPNDRPYRQEVVDSMKVVIRRVQTFYAEQMDAHGYGIRTFHFETDPRGEPPVHRVDGQQPTSHYDNTYAAATLDEIMQSFDLDQNIYLIVIDNGKYSVGDSAGRGRRRGKNGGYAWVAGNFGWKVVVHELGHAFGLQHDFRDGAYIMSYGPGWAGLSACAAEFLAVHPYFNPDSPIREGQPPTIELVSPTGYPAGSQSVSIQLKVSDPEGVHQVVLFVPGFANIELKACRGATNKKDAAVEFEYDGVIPSEIGTTLSNPISHPIIVEAVDTDGNVRQERWGLAEMSPYHIATLEGHTDLVSSVAFSPDGTLASGSWDGTARLWNIETRRQKARLQQGSGDSKVVSVAFSPEGNILAAVSGGAGLWDVATERRIANLRGGGQPYSAAFSPDGTLALGLWNGEIELWNVETKRQIATLREHSAWVRTVAFSQDGTLLASGSNDGLLLLWDVGARRRIATPEGHTRGVASVAFSRDGSFLVSGSEDRTVKLWDMATRQNIATIEEHTYRVQAVSFSPDGTLVSGDARGVIMLWDAATQERIARFAHRGGVHSVAFAPDGRILASGSGDGTISLWNIAPHPELTASVESPLTEATLSGSLVTLTLSSGTFASWNTVRNNVTVSGIDGVTFRSTTDVERVSDTEVTVRLTFNGNIDTDARLTFTVGADAIAGYTGSALTVEIPVTAVAESVVASAQQPLTEATLHGSVVTLTLSSGRFASWNTVRNNVTVSGIEGVTFRSSTDVERLSDTEVTIELAFNGNIDTDTTLTFTVGASAIAGYTGPALAAEIPVSADEEATPDFDGDGKVGFSDFILFATVFGSSRGDAGYEARYDLDGDSAIEFGDFLIFAGSFGKDIPSSGSGGGEGGGGSSQTCALGLALNPGDGCSGSGYSLRNDAGVLVADGNIGGISMDNTRFSGGSVQLNRLHLTRSGNVWTIVGLP